MYSVSCRARLCCALCVARSHETLCFVLCEEQVRVVTLALVSFLRDGESERGRGCSSALPCPSLREPQLSPHRLLPWVLCVWVPGACPRHTQ